MADGLRATFFKSCSFAYSGALASLLIVLAAVFPRASWAYPEMVRHNYPNCISCHVSPTGGGVLTQYGRSLSGAILSTWGTENETESKFVYGVIPLPGWLDAMGMYRGAYAYQNTPSIQQGEYIFMQNDVEAAAHFEHWYLHAAAGYQNPVGAQTWTDHLISRRHYLGYEPTDTLSFRAGRFFPAFGINTAEHVIPTRQDLGFDESQNAESYNLEAAWIGEVLNVFATLDLGRPDDPSQHHETGAALTSSVAIESHYKIGASYYYGNGQSTTRNLVGPWAILGFTPHFFLLSEWDFQEQSAKTGSTPSNWGAVNYQKLDYEIVQGAHVYLTQDYSRLGFGDPTTMHNSFGLGAQWFPRPHFEINLEWQKLKSAMIADGYTDFAWIMFNIYL